MICDDSAVIRGALARILEADPEIAVVAKVENGKLAVEQIRAAQVDVVVLDIEMPVMDGMTALPQLLRADPGVRVIMASTLTTRGAEIALRALRLGAADYVPKPSSIGTVRRRRLSAGTAGEGQGPGPHAPPGRHAGARPAADRAAAGAAGSGASARHRQLDRRAAGAVHPGPGPGTVGRRAGGDDPAHAGDLHPDPGGSSQPPRPDALHRGARRRIAGCRAGSTWRRATGICWWRAAAPACARG